MQNINLFERKITHNYILTFIKNNIISVIFLAFTVSLVIFSKNNFIAAQDGLLLWAKNIVPSLLPFFIATELLNHTIWIKILGKVLSPIMRPLFHVPGIGSYALLMGIISGYPTGAKIVVNLKENGLCTKEEAERLLAFTNNSGPLFILGTVGICMFGNSAIGFLLLFTHILACFSVGIIFRFYKYKKGISYSNNSSNISMQQVDFANLGNILSKSIFSAIKTITIIGGFVVLFSVIISILKNSSIIQFLAKILFPFFNIFGIKDINFSSGFVCGILELTNGIAQIVSIPCKQISINILLSAFLLGFGGLSILFQVYSIIAKSNISIKPYFWGKLLHGFLACFYTFILINCFPIFNLNL